MLSKRLNRLASIIVVLTEPLVDYTGWSIPAIDASVAKYKRRCGEYRYVLSAILLKNFSEKFNFSASFRSDSDMSCVEIVAHRRSLAPV